MTAKDITAERFDAAGVAKGRFVSVRDGEKMCVDHDTRYDTPHAVPGSNYGIYCDEDDQLVVLDVDAHRNDTDADRDEKALVALAGLGFTLRVRSPHADPEIGGHRIYVLEGDETPAELFDRVFGRKNPVPSWGEVVAKNKYVVGPGSQLNGCSKDWCDRCSTEDGGHYDLEDDRDIATITPDELVDALAADHDLERVDTPDHSDITEYSGEDSNKRPDEELSREDVEELLDTIPGDQHFDDWIRTGYAVFSWDSGERGKEVFTEWSKSNKDWERDESQRQIDYIWKNGDDTDSDRNAGVGTLVHIARENGYDGSLGAQKQRPEPEMSTDWADVRALYEYAQKEDNYPKGNARMAAANVLESETSYMYVLESEVLWVYDDESGTYDRYGRSQAASRLESKLREHYGGAERREVIERLQARNQVHRHQVNARDRDDPLVCVGNGVVNLRTGELKDHSPEYRFIRGLDVNFDPEAAAPSKILEFLDEITEREADRDTLLDHLAHGLMPGHPYRAFVVCYGPGGNGKTQVSELFRGFVGRENAAAVEIDELANGDFATGDLPGTFINWGDDMAGDGGGQLSDLSLLKKATGGSEIRANEKYEKTFNFKNEAAMFFSANEPPRIGEQKHSIEDRIYPIEMPYRFKSNPDPDNPMEKEKTPKASAALLDDDAAMMGLLQLAVEHAETLIKTRGEYSQPESPSERLEKYNRSADPIVMFAGRLLEDAPGEYRIRKDDVYRAYRAFCESVDERAAGERGFKRQLPASVPMEVEDARSRALATPDDEADRVRCWKRMKWTDTAKAHMPDWMVGRYTEHFETTESRENSTDEAAEGGSNPTLKQLDPGRHTVEATLLERKEPKPWLAGEGVLGDDRDGYDTELLDYVADGDTDPLAAAAEGDRVRITNAKIATDRDGLKRVEVSGVCDVEIIETAPDGQATVDDTPDATAATDGSGDGYEQATAKVEKLLDDADEPLTMADVVKRVNIKRPDRAKEALETAVTNGRVIECGDDLYRTD